MEINEESIDTFNGITFKWCFVSKSKPTREYYTNDDPDSGTMSRVYNLRSLELTFHIKNTKIFTLNSYLPFILNEAKTKTRHDKNVKSYSRSRTMFRRHPTKWTSVNLDHPSMLETVAMDDGMKEKVTKDLNRFLKRREYYRQVGKAWKRGYLLYGPPGTGRSSLIAATENFLKFDIYDLELSDIRSNSESRRLMVATANWSMLVVEDIDCSLELHDRVNDVGVMGNPWNPFAQKQNKV